MGGLKINSRLNLTVILQFAALVIVGFIAYLGMNRISNALVDINQGFVEQVSLEQLGETLRDDLLKVVNNAARNISTWEQANTDLPAVEKKFQEGWKKFLDSADTAEKEHIQQTFKPSLASLNDAFAQLKKLFSAQNRPQLNLFIENDFEELTNPFYETLVSHVVSHQKSSEESIKSAQNTSNLFTIIIVVIGLIGVAISFILGGSTYRAIINPINQMTATVHQVGAGDYTARTSLKGSDELAELGRAFDRMLDERLHTLVESEYENNRLNDSIIGLLQAVSQISQRDLTVRVPVTEDMTGPVADALNLLTDETAAVLQNVTRISEEVAAASDKVKAQSDTVIAVAETERQAVEQTAAELAAAAITMKQIAQLAQDCNASAETTIKTTQGALQTVTSTVIGINSTRDTIRETEKRIKRLGERSQEISGVVNLINTIAERTHILALNASMHAASAGEAGRGFAVVADEVQRLAENAREATSQISTLVSNIQIETADTVNAMNAAISQVVDGSRLAEQAGEQMKQTQEITTELVTAVQQIAARSQEQARVSNELLNRAEQIQASTHQTSQQLSEQTVQTTNLVEYAKNLLSSVRVFRLPA